MWVKDRVGGGDWLLRRGCTCGTSVCGGVGVRQGVHISCVVWVLSCALFSVGVELSEGRWVCGMLLGVLLSCIVGWRVIMGLTGVMFVVLKARGVVTGGVARVLHLEKVQVFVYCLVLISVVQIAWTKSLQEMHRRESLNFLLVVIHWEQMGHMMGHVVQG